MLQNDDGTSKTISPSLIRHLAEVKRNGHERMRSLQIPAATNLAVPVVGPLETVVATLACPFVERLDRHNLGDTQFAAEQLRAAAAKISSSSPARFKATPRREPVLIRDADEDLDHCRADRDGSVPTSSRHRLERLP